jgi:hypothetical protein
MTIYLGSGRAGLSVPRRIVSEVGGEGWWRMIILARH